MRKNEAVWIASRNRWQINVQSDGERRTFISTIPYRPDKKTQPGKVEAEKKADKWLENRLIDENCRVGVLLDKYYEKIQLTTSKSYYLQYEKYIRLYTRPVIGTKRISKLTAADLQGVIDRAYNERHLSEKTLTNVRGFLMSFLKYCRGLKATALFVEELSIPRGAKRTSKDIIHPEEIPMLFYSSETLWRGKPVEDFYIHAYRFAVLTGLRPGELIGLENKNVIGNKITITQSINEYDEFTDGKNDNARRTFYIGEKAQKVLEDQKEMLRKAGCISRYVFPNKNMDFISQQNFRRAWQRYCAYNGIEHAQTPYELRHTFVSVNVEMPEGLKKMVVGHSTNMDTEGTYSHKKKGDMEKAADFTDDAFDKILNS